jgi:rhodanese-related sulfurtransferase
MKPFFTLFSLLLVFFAGCISQSADLHMISEEELSKELNDTNIVILDVRTLDEYQQGHIVHAKLLDVYDSDFRSEVKQLNKNKTYIVYCASGGRAAKASKIMMQDGIEQVFDLKYGYNHWKGQVEK